MRPDTDPETTTVHRAEGALSVRLGTSVEGAAQALRERAAATGTSVLTAALTVLGDKVPTNHRGPLDPWGSC